MDIGFITIVGLHGSLSKQRWQVLVHDDVLKKEMITLPIKKHGAVVGYWVMLIIAKLLENKID
jgi:hypothetical protein